ncbi:MAG: hypothetical protein KTR18_15520 [Acidiferrobacterales bacterium]|nr:hypothetical protein [Acidiferrobacterales bacterium]
MIADFKDWLGNFLPYSLESWKGLLAHYNQTWWPYSAASVVLAVGLLWLVFRPSLLHGRVTLWLLGICWAWVGWFFIGDQFATLNWSARYFSWLFILQSFLLIIYSFHGEMKKLSKKTRPKLWSSTLVFASMLVIPCIQILSGYSINQLGWFALTPDATALTTVTLLGMLNFLPTGLWIIPIIWSLFVFTYSWPLGDIPGMSLFLCIATLLMAFKLRRAD